MIDFDYLSKGLNALARAHRMSSMAGHLGASLIAGYFVGEQRPDLEPEVYRGIEDDLERVMRGESVFGKKMSKNSKLADPEMFEPFPKQKPDETLVDGIAEELEKSIAQPRQSGHNVIFASLAIRALREHPEFATPAVVDGILKLMALFVDATPGSGYYGKDRGRIQGSKITLPEEDGTAEYDDIEGMAIAIFDEAIALKPETHRIGYGGLVHVINHAAAIADLGEFGYPELVPRAVRSHRHHLRLWRSLPNVADEKGPMQVSRFTAHTAAYWTSGTIPYDRALLTHRVKTLFGFDELAATVDEEAKEKAAYDKLRFLM
ncbi:MAG: hypothetical protein P1U85_18475 [Verrucomicrobiales bacterium]|nr:hypothetical protein [Verrucomicrobiales bacterium]